MDLFFHTFSSNKLVKQKTEQKIKIIASERQDTLKRKTFCLPSTLGTFIILFDSIYFSVSLSKLRN